MSKPLTALELLMKELAEYKRAKTKAEQAFNNGKIDKETYDRYITNLTPIIEDYTNAVRVLNIYA
jgi:hypothetical protein